MFLQAPAHGFPFLQVYFSSFLPVFDRGSWCQVTSAGSRPDPSPTLRGRGLHMSLSLHYCRGLLVPPDGVPSGGTVRPRSRDIIQGFHCGNNVASEWAQGRRNPSATSIKSVMKTRGEGRGNSSSCCFTLLVPCKV